MVAAYLLTWLVGVTFSVFDEGHEISDEISKYSWRFFSVASIVNIVLLWVASLAAFFALRWSSWLFLLNVAYALAYISVFGGGAGSPLNMVIGTIHSMLAGVILYALLLIEHGRLGRSDGQLDQNRGG
jgi:hypothetical protein